MSGKFSFPSLIEISVINADSVNPDQTPHSAASDLGLLCLPMPLLCDARLKWVKRTTFISDLTFNGFSTTIKNPCLSSGRFGSIANHVVSCQDSDQILCVRRLIRVFVGRTCILVENVVPGVRN